MKTWRREPVRHQRLHFHPPSRNPHSQPSPQNPKAPQHQVENTRFYKISPDGASTCGSPRPLLVHTFYSPRPSSPLLSIRPTPTMPPPSLCRTRSLSPTLRQPLTRARTWMSSPHSTSISDTATIDWLPRLPIAIGRSPQSHFPAPLALTWLCWRGEDLPPLPKPLGKDQSGIRCSPAG